jgi:hypothetical protein
VTAAARPAPRTARPAVDPDAPDATAWSADLRRLITDEVRRALALRLLTAAEADQLLARLVLVIDQSVSPVRV